MENLEEKTENKFEGLYIIGYGLSGGFGGQRNFEVIEADDQEEADQLAWEAACDEYDNYAGSNGLRDVDEIMDEDGIEDEDEAWEVFTEERESWLDYSAHPYSKEYEKKISGNHYENSFTEITG